MIKVFVMFANFTWTKHFLKTKFETVYLTPLRTMEITILLVIGDLV